MSCLHPFPSLRALSRDIDRIADQFPSEIRLVGPWIPEDIELVSRIIAKPRTDLDHEDYSIIFCSEFPDQVRFLASALDFVWAQKVGAIEVYEMVLVHLISFESYLMDLEIIEKLKSAIIEVLVDSSGTRPLAGQASGQMRSRIEWQLEMSFLNAIDLIPPPPPPPSPDPFSSSTASDFILSGWREWMQSTTVSSKARAIHSCICCDLYVDDRFLAATIKDAYRKNKRHFIEIMRADPPFSSAMSAAASIAGEDYALFARRISEISGAEEE